MPNELVGRHLLEAGELAELALERRGHRRGHDVGARAGVEGQDPDGRVVHLGQRGDRELPVGHHPDQEHARREQRGRHRTEDEEPRRIHWLAGRYPEITPDVHRTAPGVASFTALGTALGKALGRGAGSGRVRMSSGARSTSPSAFRERRPVDRWEHERLDRVARGSISLTDNLASTLGNTGDPHVDQVPLQAAGRADRMEVRGADRDRLHLGVRGRAREAPRRSTTRARSSSGTPPTASTGRWTSTPRTRWSWTTAQSRSSARRLGPAHREGKGDASATTCRPRRSRSSCTASRARSSPPPRSSRRCPTSTRSSTPRPRSWTRRATSRPTRASSTRSSSSRIRSRPGSRPLLEQTISDRRWDMTYLGMQILIEGLALAAFQRIRDTAKNRLAAAVNAYVMQDEARHVAFGRLALRDYYPQLSDGRARRARGVRGRGLLPHARPLQPARGVGDARPARRGVHRRRPCSRSRCSSSARACSPASCPP